MRASSQPRLTSNIAGDGIARHERSRPCASSAHEITRGRAATARRSLLPYVVATLVAVPLTSDNARFRDSVVAGPSSSSRPPAKPAARPRGAVGLASYYGDELQGELTASGVPFDSNAFVAAHPTYPFDTIVRVTNLENSRSVRVRIVDRGPGEGPRAEGVIIDLSRRAARALRFIEDGRTPVRVRVLRWGDEPAGPRGTASPESDQGRPSGTRIPGV